MDSSQLFLENFMEPFIMTWGRISTVSGCFVVLFLHLLVTQQELDDFCYFQCLLAYKFWGSMGSDQLFLESFMEPFVII